jgi:hypothetical protein
LGGGGERRSEGRGAARCGSEERHDVGARGGAGGAEWNWGLGLEELLYIVDVGPVGLRGIVDWCFEVGPIPLV